MKKTSLAREQSDYEVADIFRQYGTQYREENRLTGKQYKVMRAIEHCRSSEMGHHLDMCNKCSHMEREYNSCRDRHCPKCQGISRRKWVDARMKDILPVSYYHVVFTLPHLLEELISYNEALSYDLLFYSASETLLAFGRDPKWLGGELGFHAVLHTWGQKLWRHPHLHMIVPGGALTPDNRWVVPRYRGKFLFPVHALSKVFRGKFIEGLKTARSENKLKIPPTMAYLNRDDQFENWINMLVARKWVVYCKRPFKNPEHVIGYIGRYTHRVAISNGRILDPQDGYVRFLYKDYKGFKASGKLWKILQLAPHMFIRRFMAHVLPSGFHKIRHYGFLANGRRKARIKLICSLIDAACSNDEGSTDTQPYRVPCPECKEGVLMPLFIFTRYCKLVTATGMRYLEGLTWDTS